MEDEKDILKRAAEVLKNEEIPPGPPKDLVDKTMARLTEASAQSETIRIGNRIRIRDRLRGINKLSRVAAAAVLLIVSGFAVGRFSAPRPPDMEELQETLVPAIRAELLDEINQQLESSYASLTEDFDRQYRQDLNRVAIQILKASNTATDERLIELIESFKEYQSQERQWFTTMLERIESNRLQDSALLSDALVTVAQQTEAELERTKNMVQQLSYAQPAGFDPKHIGKPEN